MPICSGEGRIVAEGIAMTEMTKEERVLAALSREEPDRVPLYDLLDNLAVYEHYAGQKLTLENAEEVVPLALSRALDHTRIWLPAPPGRRVDERGFTHERVDWFNEWQVDTPFHDLAGAIAFVRADIERAEAAPAGDLQAQGLAPDSLREAQPPFDDVFERLIRQHQRREQAP